MSNIRTVYAGLVLISGPTTGSPPVPTEPVSLADLKQTLRIPLAFTADDADLSLMITTARQRCETIMRRAFINQTWRLSLTNWPGRDYQNWPAGMTSEIGQYYQENYIPLPFPPLQTVLTLQYMNSSGQLLYMTPANYQVLSGFTYNIFPDFEPGRVVLPFSQIWPTDILMPGAPVQITYTCGYPDAPTFLTAFEGAPSVIRAINMMCGYWYENKIPPSEMRRSSITAGVEYVAEQLLTEYRCFDGCE